MYVKYIQKNMKTGGIFMQKNGFRGKLAGALSLMLTGAVLVGAMCFPGKTRMLRQAPKN